MTSLQRGILQRQVGIHALELAVLAFELLQPLDIRGLQLADTWLSTYS